MHNNVLNVNTITIGYNHYQPYKCDSIHAEEHALSKLEINKSKRNMHISVLVVRICQDGTYANSKPCIKCTHKLNTMYQYGYIIDWVYYSGVTGEIEKCKLRDLQPKPAKVSYRL